MRSSDMSRGDLRLSVVRQNDETVVTLGGELDVSNTDALATVVNEVLADGAARVVLDLADLSFCDSRGLGTLIVLSRAAQLQQAYLVLRHPSASFGRMLDVTGMRAGLNITDGSPPR